MSTKQIEIQTKKLSQLMSLIDEGRFAIPKLQREFVWDGPKAAKLFDSMLAHMPIGVVMIWDTPKNQMLYLRQKYHILPPFNSRNKRVWFLIDGQQRISVSHHVAQGGTLQNAKRKDVHFGRVVFALQEEEDGQQIRYRKRVDGQYESLSDILHPNWKAKLSHLGKQHLARVRKCRDRIRNYPMQMMFVRNDVNIIKEAFRRINTLGMKLATADSIISEVDDLNIADIKHEVHMKVPHDFGQIPEMPILFAMAAIRGATEPSGKGLRAAIKKLESEGKANPAIRKTLSKDWHRLVKCFEKAVQYLRMHFSVLNRNFLYSDYMVAMLALFYFWQGNGPGAKQARQIRKWFWATAVGSRYSGSSFRRSLTEDLRFIKKLARNPNVSFTYKPEVERADVRKSVYASRTGITTAFYCMLLRRGPVHLTENGVNPIVPEYFMGTTSKKDRHHIFPKGVLGPLGIPAKVYNSICNICLLTAEENRSIGMRRPRSYLQEYLESTTYFKAKVARHLIPCGENAAVWQTDARKSFKQFMNDRMTLICNELEREAGIRLFRKAE